MLPVIPITLTVQSIVGRKRGRPPKNRSDNEDIVNHNDQFNQLSSSAPCTIEDFIIPSVTPEDFVVTVTFNGAATENQQPVQAEEQQLKDVEESNPNVLIPTERIQSVHSSIRTKNDGQMN